MDNDARTVDDGLTNSEIEFKPTFDFTYYKDKISS